jgi:hypothetical protein
MNKTRDLVFLFDVDNTRLNNDHVERDLREYLRSYFGTQARDRFLTIFENIDLHHIGDLLKYDLAAFLKNELREGKV